MGTWDALLPRQVPMSLVSVILDLTLLPVVVVVQIGAAFVKSSSLIVDNVLVRLLRL